MLYFLSVFNCDYYNTLNTFKSQGISAHRFNLTFIKKYNIIYPADKSNPNQKRGLLKKELL
tara:strand:- start:5920 stop:6102 length:183 start_codon:yes stop_codon:yes gene_type:complete